jgi:exopolyphosphatase/guanosine-5'-triphosphate,3'-diphosphate pyrophosphatase
MAATDSQKTYAAIDLGSNSFHMVVAQEDGNNIRIVDSLRNPVRLGDGLDKQKNITNDTQARALQTLSQFAQRLRGVPKRCIRVVGTNTLRRARNRKQFMAQALEILGKPIEVISGREEARLIFSAVSHALPELDAKRLVIDIGGGSTELIIGKKRKPCLMESINIGSVSWSRAFFPDGKLSKEKFKKAVLAAQLELEHVQQSYTKKGWNEAIGCSGTIKAVSRILLELGLTDGVITLAGINALVDKMCKATEISKLELESISKDRAQVITGGLAVLKAIMKSLDIDALHASQVALREGLIFDMIGQVEHHNTQMQTIDGLINRYTIDAEQSARVEKTVVRLFELAAESWRLDPTTDLQQVCWVAQLHEVGLGISHSKHHKHGAYILENSDLLGFSIAEQTVLAFLVRNQRRKLDMDTFTSYSDAEQFRLGGMLTIIRLAVLLHRGRHDSTASKLNYKIKENQLTVLADERWLEQHPLTAAKLTREAEHLLPIDIRLKVKISNR